MTYSQTPITYRFIETQSKGAEHYVSHYSRSPPSLGCEKGLQKVPAQQRAAP